jgi:hypothetical protein
MSELKPCPFCGEYPKFYGAGDGSGFESIDCINDDCITSVTTGYMDYKAAFEAWNTRAAPKVKALNWKELPDAEIYGLVYQARCPLGTLSISKTKLHGWGVWIINGSNQQLIFWKHKSCAEAKAAAQSHYAKLILEALK